MFYLERGGINHLGSGSNNSPGRALAAATYET
jgi:hypothetical protein